MSDDRAWLHQVGAGLIADLCSYSCWAKESTGCGRSTGYQPDKEATGMRRLTDEERRFYYLLGCGQQMPSARVMGSFTCETHAPRTCRGCFERIPWWDAGMCDFCDRYTDETG